MSEALRALLAEAEAALSPEEAETAAAIQRIEAARRKRDDALLLKRRTVLAQQVDRLRKAANGAYVVEPFDMEDKTPGAGMYVLRSPSRDAWKKSQDAFSASNGDGAKIERAYVNLAAACILWSDAPDGADEWAAHREKYPGLVVAIGDAAGALGGAADRARKR